MNHNNLRAAAIGVTAGVTAGIVTIAGVIVWEDYDPWDKAKKAVARHRLSPQERAELDELLADQANKGTERDRARAAAKAATRAKFRPDYLSPEFKTCTLEQLPIPALISEITWLTEHCTQPGTRPEWWSHRDALLDEFDRRNSWTVKRRLPELDQLRLDAAAANHINDVRYAMPVPVPARVAPANDPATDVPDFGSSEDKPTH